MASLCELHAAPPRTSAGAHRGFALEEGTEGEATGGGARGAGEVKKARMPRQGPPLPPGASRAGAAASLPAVPPRPLTEALLQAAFERAMRDPEPRLPSVVVSTTEYDWWKRYLRIQP